LDKGENERAAQAFESGLHQGYAYYEMGDLEKAAEAYSNDVSPEGFYNLGVVYSQMGDLEAAQQAFDAALQQDPKFEKANTNLVLVTKTLDSLALIKAIEEGKSSEASGDPKEFQEYNEQPDEKDVAQESDEKYEGKGDIQEMVTKEVDESTIDIFEFDALENTFTLKGGKIISSNGVTVNGKTVQWVNHYGPMEATLTEASGNSVLIIFAVIILIVISIFILISVVGGGVFFWRKSKSNNQYKETSFVNVAPNHIIEHIFCPNCGKEQRHEAQFCPHCGHKIAT